MEKIAGFGAVVFARDIDRLASFYEALVPMRRIHAEKDHIVLDSGAVELVIHGIPKRIADAIAIGDPPQAREATPIKLFFQVDSLAAVRAQAPALGGRLSPPSKEWEARGFRACDGVDPEGNVVQFRELAKG